jgi:L-aspartate oxidase
MATKHYDVLIIGSGIAGLSAAIKLSESRKIKIGILARDIDPKITNTYYAQGGIVYAPGNQKEFSEDIIRASSMTSNVEAVKILASRSAAIFDEILVKKAYVDFEMTPQGCLALTREAAHRIPRIAYKGDFTGKVIQESLLKHVLDKNIYPNIEILPGHTAIDLITPDHHGIELNQRYEDNTVVGVYAYCQKTGSVIKILAKRTILATGGMAGLYLHHSNAEGIRGDGHAMASRAGAIMSNMEFIQFHPTTFFDSSSSRRFLISEAVRGEGGVLVNDIGEAFMEKYSKEKELAPRDVVSRAIAQEMISRKHDCVYLDISHKDPEWIKTRFPTIYQRCLEKKVDITKEPIPVVPAAHYTCGGIKTDLMGRTNLKGLYAVGEVACTGLHGANRLASTSLLEGLTWGYIAAEDIASNVENSKIYDNARIRDWEEATGENEAALIAQDWMALKHTMWNYAGITRSTHRLGRARGILGELSFAVQEFYRHAKLSDDLIGLRNAVEVAKMVVKASMENRHSIGCFYRPS